MATDNTNKLFDNGNSNPGIDVPKTPDSDNNEKFLGKIKRQVTDSANDFSSDLTTSAKSLKDGALSSLKDRFKSKESRNVTNSDFKPQQVSIANVNKDAISGILNNTYNGNLFDAGISSLNLYNIGTKWTNMVDQYVDKDLYPFRYLYYLHGSVDDAVTEGDEGLIGKSSTDLFNILDAIEDPTMLGFTIKIDSSEVSPLFGNDITNFITNYLGTGGYKELTYAQDYLDLFKANISKIFTSPETGESKSNLKSHYITKIDGLDKLDKLFVDYAEENKDHEALTFTLSEDVRMFTNRLAFLYRNLTYSYNLGKKLIPENLLRFNLFIKISDYRTFTGVEPLRDSIRNEYSRVIYELRDCEFLFDSSLNPSSLTMSGFSEVNKSFAELPLKIKYKKVNRIFYSSLFDGDNKAMLIGDKYFTPNTKLYADDKRKFASDSVSSKRDVTDNNFPVQTSLRDRYDNLKNAGLLTQDDDDSAITRFGKTMTNKAVKAGAKVLDNGLNNVKNTIETSTRSFLQSKIKTKTINLGSLHKTNDEGDGLNVNGQLSSKNYLTTVSTPANDVSKTVKAQQPIKKEDLHPNTNQSITSPKEDLHPVSDNQIKIDKVDLHPDANANIINPNEDLHPTSKDGIQNPNEDLQPNTNSVIGVPKEDLHTDPNHQYENPKESLNGEVDNIIKNPKEDLNPAIEFVIKNPKENLNTKTDNVITEPKTIPNNAVNKISDPKEDLHNTIEENIIHPNENLNVVSENTITEPKENLNGKSDSDIKTPKENLSSSLENSINEPKEDLHPIIEDSTMSPKEDLHGPTNSEIKYSDTFKDLKSFKDYLKNKPKDI